MAEPCDVPPNVEIAIDLPFTSSFVLMAGMHQSPSVRRVLFIATTFTGVSVATELSAVDAPPTK